MRIGRLVGLGACGVVAFTLFAGSALAADGFTGWDEKDRRDPFEFRAPEPEKLVPTRRDKKENGGEGTKRLPPPPVDLDKLMDYARECEDICRGYLSSEQYEQAARTTGRILGDLRKAGLDNGEVFERLSSINEAASRLHRRSEIEKQLRELPIDLQGIVWSETNPIALIDGEIRRKGDVISGATIESVGRNGIVLEMDEVRVRREFGRQPSGR